MKLGRAAEVSMATALALRPTSFSWRAMATPSSA
jgi:hypothetical protein